MPDEKSLVLSEAERQQIVEQRKQQDQLERARKEREADQALLDAVLTKPVSQITGQEIDGARRELTRFLAEQRQQQ